MNYITESTEDERAETLLNIKEQLAGDTGWVMVCRGQTKRNGTQMLTYVHYAKYPWNRPTKSPELSIHRITA